MSHPDRAAATLANIADERARRGNGPFDAPGAGALDCRIDGKLLQWRALAAAARGERAAARLAAFAAAEHPDLWAGTVQDGVARGFAVALEETIALAPPEPAPPTLDLAEATLVEGRELKKRKDLLVKSGGARVRFSRKEGLLFVDRDDGAHSANCMRFEARRDTGTLDAFTPDDTERPRLWSAQFLAPRRYTTARGAAQLVLAGRLGRGPVGWPCEVTLTGHDAEPFVHLEVRIDGGVADHRLRVLFLGMSPAAIAHDCTPVREIVQNDAGGFVAFTLLRACGTLLVDGERTAVPDAQCRRPIVHRFRLGGAITSS